MIDHKIEFLQQRIQKNVEYNIYIADGDRLTIIVMINMKDYPDGQHTFEIVGLTSMTEILRTTVKFYGQG